MNWNTDFLYQINRTIYYYIYSEAAKSNDTFLPHVG